MKTKLNFRISIMLLTLIAAISSAWAQDVTPPMLPANKAVSVTKLTSNSVTIEWEKATDNVTLPANLKYQLWYQTTPSVKYRVTTLTNATSHTFNNLKTGQTYTYWVVVADEAGNESKYDEVNATPVVVDTPPVLPADATLKVSDITSNSIKVSWNKATGDTADEKIRYQVWLSDNNDDYNSQNGSGTLDINSFNIIDLDAKTRYWITVWALDEAGNRSIYSPAIVTTLPEADITPPTVPDEKITTSVTHNSISLSWNKATDLVTMQHNLMYRIGYAKKTAKLKEMYTAYQVDITSGTVTAEIEPNTTYYVTVQVKDEAGNMATYELKEVVTNEEPPSTIAVTAVLLNKSATTIVAGNTEMLTAVIAPDDATNKSVNWTSSNTAVATVAGGVVTAVSAGSATIIVTTVDGGETATCNVTVTAAPVSVTAVNLNKSATTIYTGNTETLTATIAPTDATNKAINWTSSNTAVATVAGGVVTAIAPGTATIIATTVDGGKTATCAVTVTNDPVANTIAIVDDGLLKAYPNPTDGPLTLDGLTPGATIRIYSPFGTLAATHKAADATITLDLSSLAAGMYFINVDGRTIKVIRK